MQAYFGAYSIMFTFSKAAASPQMVELKLFKTPLKLQNITLHPLMLIQIS